MGVGGEVTYFWNLSKSVFRHNNENGFLSNLGGGVRASLTFVKLFFF